MEQVKTRTRALGLALGTLVLLLLLAVPGQALAKSLSSYRTVKVQKGYLALRTAPSYDEANEIGELYTGDVIRVVDKYNGSYWWVYSPKYNRRGYVNKDYLNSFDLGKQKSYRVKVAKGYLALRTKPSYDEANEVGELYTGDTVTYVETHKNKKYWWVYSAKYGRCGYVNKDYLTTGSTTSSSATSTAYTVKVAKGYLALRNKPAYDEANEIGELYTGDTVMYISTYDNTYWWVYSPKHNRSGYVNKNYLVAPSSNMDYSVKVQKGYLALRTKPSYDESNEVGELYTGDTVTLINKYNDTYWWVYSPKHSRSGYVNRNYLVKK